MKNLLEQIQSRLDELNKAERKVAEVILQNPQQATRFSIAALAMGLFTRPAAVVLIFTMAIAGLVGHKGSGYLITNDPPGAEYTINLAALCFVFLLTGPGAFSLDALLF